MAKDKYGYNIPVGISRQFSALMKKEVALLTRNCCFIVWELIIPIVLIFFVGLITVLIKGQDSPPQPAHIVTSDEAKLLPYSAASGGGQDVITLMNFTYPSNPSDDLITDIGYLPTTDITFSSSTDYGMLGTLGLGVNSSGDDTSIDPPYLRWQDTSSTDVSDPAETAYFPSFSQGSSSSTADDYDAWLYDRIQYLQEDNNWSSDDLPFLMPSAVFDIFQYNKKEYICTSDHLFKGTKDLYLPTLGYALQLDNDQEVSPGHTNAPVRILDHMNYIFMAQMRFNSTEVNDPFSIDCSKQGMSYMDYSTNNASTVPEKIGMFLYPVALSLMFPALTHGMVEERGTEIRQFMQMMGLKSTTYVVVMGIIQLCVCVFVSLVVIAFGAMWTIDFFIETSFLGYFLLFIVYSYCQVATAYFVAAFFSSPGLAAVIAYGVALANYIIYQASEEIAGSVDAMGAAWNINPHWAAYKVFNMFSLTLIDDDNPHGITTSELFHGEGSAMWGRLGCCLLGSIVLHIL
ncbi:ABC transporter A like protein, partial [Aduncisulcus paluster]